MNRYTVSWAMEYDAESPDDAFMQAIADLDDVVNRQVGPSLFLIKNNTAEDNNAYTTIDYELWIQDPRCDICGRLMEDSPNVFDYGPATEADWNGETGNHLLCEKNEKIKAV